MWRVRIHEHECGLLFSKDRFVRWLPPGSHRLWRPWRDRIEKVNRLEPHFRHPRLDVLLQDASLRRRLEVLDLEGSQRAMIWKDGRLACVVGAGRHAFWKGPGALQIELRDAGEGRLEHPRLTEVIRHADACTLFSVVNVAADEELLLLREGVLVEKLGPGPHVFWQGGGSLQWKIAARFEGNAVERPQVARIELPEKMGIAERPRMKSERSV